jgi:spore coat polysaccharide biosynthesis protein SpsF (cytidylyltransferase family)
MIIAVLQARLSSSRLPGKVLKPILDQPMLALQIERIKRSQLIDQLVVATSTSPEDEQISKLCQEIEVVSFRGSLDDVLERVYQAAKPYSPTYLVRLTGDCPLCDPELIDQVIKFHVDGNYDYSSNCLIPTYPDGLDVEICRFQCLEIAEKEATLPSHREHVTPFINQQPDRFKLGNYQHDQDLSYLRWTVDELADFELVRQIYTNLYPQNPSFNMRDILDWLYQHPEWQTHNNKYERNEGFTKSLLADQEFLVQTN